MNSKREVELQTAANSPSKISQDRTYSLRQSQNFINKNHFANSVSTTSETQKEMYSHSLIRDVMQSSRARSIWHDINRINKDEELYAKPIKVDIDQYKFDQIPSSNRMFASHCSAKIKQIRQGLDESKVRVDRKQSKQYSNSKLYVKQSPASARINTNNPKVSVSGLVSYNFNSVNARKSLGLNKINHQQRMIDAIEQSHKRKSCSLQRADRILANTSSRRFNKHSKNQQAIMSDFEGCTDNYLIDIQRVKQEKTLVYNQCSKKLNFIKEYMAQQKVSFDDAAHIVSEIEGCHKVKKIVTKHQINKSNTNDESLLNGRRLPIQTKPVLIKHFLFIQ